MRVPVLCYIGIMRDLYSTLLELVHCDRGLHTTELWKGRGSYWYSMMGSGAEMGRNVGT